MKIKAKSNSTVLFYVYDNNFVIRDPTGCLLHTASATVFHLFNA